MEFNQYFARFLTTLEKHCKNEFEVPIRCRRITDDGEDMLNILEDEFKLMQYEENILKIIDKYKNHHRIRSQTYVKDLLNVVADDLIYEAENFVSKKHNEILKERRSSNMKLCSLKSRAGPSLINFTGVILHTKLTSVLQKGLKYVPAINPDKTELYSELKAEVVSCCKEIYRANYSRYPTVSTRDSFDDKIISIISQCEPNSDVISKLSNVRNNFVESIPAYLSSLTDCGMNVKELVSLLPKDCIVSA